VNTGHATALQESGRDPDASADPVEMFLHDVPDDVAARCVARRAHAVPVVSR
jgi:hypothetical protein